MYIYNGKLNWQSYAVNECITAVFPAAFSLDDPISLYWQWTVDAEGRPKQPVSESGRIQSVSGQKFSVNFGWYSFEGIVAADHSKVTLTMKSKQGATSSPFDVTLQQSRPVKGPSPAIYVGKLGWGEVLLKDEMFTLVMPDGAPISDGAPVGLYYQWTYDKENKPVNAKFRDTLVNEYYSKGAFDDGSSYTYFVWIKRRENKAFVFVYRGIVSDLSAVNQLETDAHGEGTLINSESGNVTDE